MPAGTIFFNCHVCKMSLSAEPERQGRLVRCPNCLSTVTVPVGSAEAAVGSKGESGAELRIESKVERATETAVPKSPPASIKRFAGTGLGRRYGFHCVYCSSRLEANESMGGDAGNCPTCGSSITIPVLNRYGQVVDAVTQEVLKPDPHPVHAYAAAGERAPKVVRQENGAQSIRCTKCGRLSPVTSNNCLHCGLPFTMEGTATDAMNTNGMATAALVLGVIGIPFSCTVVVPLLAAVFGGVALMQISASPSPTQGRWQAIAGLAMGLVGLGVALRFVIW